MIKLLDSTLREGEQTPGVCFDSHIKTVIADMLDEVGIDIIEAGHPTVTPDIRQAVEDIASRNLKAVIGAHARSIEHDVDLALECGVGFIGIFYCVSEERLNHHDKNINQAVSQITHTIHYIRQKNPGIIIRYTPEDTVRSNWSNVILAASEAVKAGADIISIADTTGYLIPGTPLNMYDFVKKLKEDLTNLNCYPQIAVHCHNDRGLALANAIDAYRAGTDIIDVTVLGLGERAGLVDLATLMAILAYDFNENHDNHWNMQIIPSLYHLVSRYSKLPIPVNFPITGANAFTHCAGVHTQAAIKNPLHYQSISPTLVGRKSSIALDHMSGISAVLYSLELIGEHSIDHETANLILAKVKEVGQTGRIVDLQELRYILDYIKSNQFNPNPVATNLETIGDANENRIFTLTYPQR